jgi:hypothetical protein
MQNPSMPKPQPVLLPERVASRIYLIRGEKVMLDSALAELYAVPSAATGTGFQKILCFR